ncbi:hypothetical protein KQX54_003125 [Cotesia glomerata]|uniref:Uncharacterized protein n=1 Tax=Cotesia glomerata TaxID=32391 RepID=A0AAV7IPF9_COTGL|nr:hypothetical protein KQX54_003125 [Cotesia glomerata]
MSGSMSCIPNLSRQLFTQTQATCAESGETRHYTPGYKSRMGFDRNEVISDGVSFGAHLWHDLKRPLDSRKCDPYIISPGLVQAQMKSGNVSDDGSLDGLFWGNMTQFPRGIMAAHVTHILMPKPAAPHIPSSFLSFHFRAHSAQLCSMVSWFIAPEKGDYPHTLLKDQL